MLPDDLEAGQFRWARIFFADDWAPVEVVHNCFDSSSLDVYALGMECESRAEDVFEWGPIIPPLEVSE